MSGTLYGVGVGPGDPELMTVKAWRLISGAHVIAYLCANGGESTALEIARPFLPETYEPIAIDMPMRVEREPAKAAYDAGAKRIAAELIKGHDVVMLCEGDPFFYGSFMYVFERLAETNAVVVVPGVISATASAAATALPLAKRDDVIKVLPATIDAGRLRDELQTAQTSVIIKVGRHFGKVKSVLGLLDLTSRATAVEHASRENQRIRRVSDITEDQLPYFTTILVRAV